MSDTDTWRHCRMDSPLGQIQLACTDHGLCGVWFATEQKHAPATEKFAPEQHRPDDPLLRLSAEQLQAYLGGRLLRFDVPLDLRAGTPFQQAVWQALLSIPHGRTGSYLALASALGKPSATRSRKRLSKTSSSSVRPWRGSHNNTKPRRLWRLTR